MGTVLKFSRVLGGSIQRENCPHECSASPGGAKLTRLASSMLPRIPRRAFCLGPPLATSWPEPHQTPAAACSHLSLATDAGDGRDGGQV